MDRIEEVHADETLGGPQIAGILNDWLEPSYGAEAVRWSLLLLTFANFASAAAFAMVGRTLRRDVTA